jgi:hypothetical protein
MVWNRDCIFDRRPKVGHAFLLPVFVLVDFFRKHTRYWLGSLHHTIDSRTRNAEMKENLSMGTRLKRRESDRNRQRLQREQIGDAKVRTTA